MDITSNEALSRSLDVLYEKQKQINRDDYLETIRRSIQKATAEGRTKCSVDFEMYVNDGIVDYQVKQLEHCILLLKEKGFTCSPVLSTASDDNYVSMLSIEIGWGTDDYGLFTKFIWFVNNLFLKIGWY